ncbi:MAG TPA: hypothetical protein VMN60_01525 [Longimicrobiales bacterium]|nr:hypothetical protein [Longimicrobiales bacterium]
MARWRAHADSAAAESPFDAMAARALPSWLALPLWLHDAWAPAASGPRALHHILWGQYALFTFIRLQDDLLDAHFHDLRIQFIADAFLADSLESFQALPLPAAFWDGYQQALRDTADAILEVRDIESVPGAFTAALLPLHARVGAIFRVGSAAVCHLLDRGDALSWVAGLQASLAVFGQVCDDLEDVADDLEQQRYTFCGNILIAAGRDDIAAAADTTARLGAGMLDASRAVPLIAALRDAAAAAAAAVPDAAPQRIRTYTAALRQRADDVDRALHESRVRHVFGPLP